MRHREREGRVAAGADQVDLVRVARGFRSPHVDDNDARAAPASLDDVRRRRRLAREVGAPQDDEVGVGGQVLLGMGFEHAREPEAVRAERPADDRGVPHLKPAEVAEAHDQRARDRADVRAVAEPHADALGASPADAARDLVERRRPADLAPGVAAARAVTPPRHTQPPLVVGDLDRGAPADAEEAATVGIVGVAADAERAPVLADLDQHPAVRGMAIHRAHRSDPCDAHADLPSATTEASIRGGLRTAQCRICSPPI